MVLMIVVQSPIPTNLDCNIFTVPDIIIVYCSSSQLCVCALVGLGLCSTTLQLL